MRNVLAVIGALVVVGTLVDLLARGGRVLRALYRNTVGRRQAAYERLAKLTTGVQIEYFTSVLGPPVQKSSREAYDEYSYVARDYYVQAVATKDGRVDLYAVTARRETFRPAIWGQVVYWSTDNSSSGLRLGDFAMADFRMKQPPDGILGWIGARRFHWAECFHFGNPGLYRTYVLAVNDAGWMYPLTVDMLDAIPVPRLALGLFAETSASDPDEIQNFLIRSDVRTFRATARPNTYAVLGTHLAFDQVSIGGIGVDADQVRTIPQ